VGARSRHALAVVAGLAVAGCGESGPSEEERLRSTVAAFGRATAARDYRAICTRLLAPALVAEVRSVGLPCEEALRRGLGEVEDPRLAIGRVTVDGERARAEVRSSARGQEPSREVVELVRVDDGWRIASLAG
jgi:hypothetical protein